MFRLLSIVAACLLGSAASAATLKNLDLALRLDSTGFSGLTIYDDSLYAVRHYGFIDATNKPLGFSKPRSPFKIGQQISQTIAFDKKSGQVSSCSTGGISCDGAFGKLTGNTFGIGDGAGRTKWGDFSLSGGTKVGDAVSLATFSGGYTYVSLVGGGYASWNAFVQNFTVVKNNGKKNGKKVLAPGVVPLPASLAFLVVGLGGFGLMARRKKKSA